MYLFSKHDYETETFTEISGVKFGAQYYLYKNWYLISSIFY